MSKEFDFKEYFENNYFRSNFLFEEILKLINHEIMFVLGVSKNAIMSLYFDDSQIIFTASSDNVIIKDVQIEFDISSYIICETYPSCNIDIIYENSEKEEVQITGSNHYVFENEVVIDYGEIRLDFEIKCNLSSYNDCLEKICASVCKEMQSYICDTLFKSKNIFYDIDFAVADSNISAINCFFKNEDLDFFTKAKILLCEGYISKFEYIKINKIISKHGIKI